MNETPNTHEQPEQQRDPNQQARPGLALRVLQLLLSVREGQPDGQEQEGRLFGEIIGDMDDGAIQEAMDDPSPATAEQRASLQRFLGERNLSGPDYFGPDGWESLTVGTAASFAVYVLAGPGNPLSGTWEDYRRAELTRSPTVIDIDDRACSLVMNSLPLESTLHLGVCDTPKERAEMERFIDQVQDLALERGIYCGVEQKFVDRDDCTHQESLDRDAIANETLAYAGLDAALARLHRALDGYAAAVRDVIETIAKSEG